MQKLKLGSSYILDNNEIVRLDTNETVIMDNNEGARNENNNGIGLAIASLVIALIGLLPTIFSAYMSIESLILSTKDSGELGDGVGSAFLIIFLIPTVIVAVVLSAISLGLGIGSLTKAKSKKVRSIGTSGTVISALCFLVSILSFVVRVLVK